MQNSDHATNNQAIPPHSIEAEQGLLGAILMNPDCIERVERIVTAPDFYEPLHQLIYDRLVQAHSEGRRISSPVLAAATMREAEHVVIPGGMTVGQYLARLLAEATTVINAPDYGLVVRDRRERRDVLAIADQLAQAAWAAVPPVEAAAAAIDGLDAIATANCAPSARAVDIGEAADCSIRRMNEAMQRPDLLPGVRTGLSELDRMLGGAQAGNLIILAGRPGMGKTALGAAIAINIAGAGIPVHFFSLEMTAESLSDRMLADLCFDPDAPICYDAIPKGRLTDGQAERLINARRRLSSAPLRIDPQAGLSVSQIAARARKHAAQLERKGKRLGMVLVDHMHLVAPSKRYSGQRVQEISETSAALKVLAKDLGVPVVALAQLNRAVETRDDKRPNLSDLRDSGAIEQDADVVMFAFREEYYLQNRLADPVAEDHRLSRLIEVRNRLELIVSKNRHGPIGPIDLFCNIAANAIRNAAPGGLV